jgi:hypothetical protein
MFSPREDLQRFLGNDFLMYFTGFYYAAERLKDFSFPLWNQYHFQGSPFFARMDLAVLYPLNLILMTIRNLFSLDIYQSFLLFEAYMLFHLTLGGFFIYLLARELKLSTHGSFLSGLIFMFSGTLLSMLNATPLITSIIWLPLINLFYLKYLRGNNANLNYWLTILIVAISHFAGYLQHTLIYNGFYLTLFLLYFLYTNKFKYKKFFIEFSKLAFIFIFSLLIYSIQFIPAYELASLSNRKSIGYNEATLSGTLKPFNIFDFITPNLIGYIKDGYVINLIPSYLYFGIAPLILFVIALLDVSNRKKVFFILAFFIFFVASMGGFTALYDFIYAFVPGMDRFRNVSKFMYLASFCFCILVGYGVDYILYKDKFKLKNLYVIFFLLSSMFFWGGYYYVRLFQLRMQNDEVPDITAFNNSLNTISLSIFFILLSLLIIYHLNNLKNKTLYYCLVILIFIDLATFNFGVQPNNSRLRPEKLFSGSPELKSFLNEDQSFYRIHLAYEPAPMHYFPELYKVYISDGYSSLIINNISNQINNRKKDNDNFAKELANASVKYIISSKILEYKDLEVVFEIPITNDNRTLYYKYGGDGVGMIPRDNGEKIYVHKNLLFTGLTNSLENEIVEFSSEKIIVRPTKNIAEDLVVRMAYYPGWKAYAAGGKEIPIDINKIGHIVIKKEFVDKDITLIYKPNNLYLGMIVSSFSIILCLYYIVKFKISKK